MNKDQLAQLGKAALDAMDGSKNGEFSPAEVGARVQAEAARLRSFSDRAARKPLEYVMGGVLLGFIVGTLFGAYLAKTL